MFSHDLRDPMLHITFRKTVESSSSTELMNLAKLAVAGDEFALDVSDVMIVQQDFRFNKQLIKALLFLFKIYLKNLAFLL